MWIMILWEISVIIMKISMRTVIRIIRIIVFIFLTLIRSIMITMVRVTFVIRMTITTGFLTIGIIVGSC